MKLLMISGDRSVLQGKRGAFWYTLEEFSKHWERIDVICPRIQKFEFRNSNFEPFPNVHFHPSPWGLLRQIKWIVKEGTRLHREVGFDVMTVHDYPPFYNGLGARALAKRIRVPYVLEAHHIIGYPKAATCSEVIGRALSRLYFPFAAKRATAIRTVNREVRSTLIKWGVPGAKVQVVPSFYLDASQLQPDPSIEKKYDVAFCGRLVANKGLPSLLRVAATLPGISLVVIGDGPERLTCEKLAASLGIADRVRFHGWMPTQQDVLREIQSARVFVMNSLSEGGPRVALEAMACGMPVIATSVGVMPEVIESGENGVLIPASERHLSDAIQFLLRDPSLQAHMGEKAREVLGRFERKKLIEGYAAFLKGLVRR